MKDLKQFIKTTIREYLNEQEFLLKEGKQIGVLYHNTNIENAKSILKTNTLRIHNNDLNSRYCPTSMLYLCRFKLT